jgi:tripeptide aminopeptidase
MRFKELTKMNLEKNILDRFLRYTAVDTMSDPDALASQHPSTDGQWDLLRMLEKELRQLGIEDVLLDSNGVVSANMKANKEGLPSIAFMAHVDTASDCNGNHVKARIVNDYDGEDIKLSSKLTLDVKSNPELSKYKGETVIVTDGTSLLGADDKAGVAEIMAAVETLVSDPSIKHGPVQIFFTSDEETGCGMDYFPMDRFSSEACYTADGGVRYVVETECFNAATVDVHFTGVSAHLGSAKNRMVNAVTMASHFISAIPQAQSPEATDGRDGYWCPYSIEGSAADVKVKLFLRDFDYDKLLDRIEALRSLAQTVGKLFAGGVVAFKSKVSYRNMNEACLKNPKATELLFKAGEQLGMPLRTELIRGGTDGARLAEKGIPCPNLFTGGDNYHSLKEWAALPAMADGARLIVQIIRCWAQD